MEIKSVLLESKKINLTPFQAYILIGLSNPNEKGFVNYQEFAPKCKTLINDLFSMKAMSEKAALIAQGAFKQAENLDEVNMTKLELFKVKNNYLLIIYLILFPSYSYSKNMTETKMGSWNNQSMWGVCKMQVLTLSKMRLSLSV